MVGNPPTFSPGSGSSKTCVPFTEVRIVCLSQVTAMWDHWLNGTEPAPGLKTPFAAMELVIVAPGVAGGSVGHARASSYSFPRLKMTRGPPGHIDGDGFTHAIIVSPKLA